MAKKKTVKRKKDASLADTPADFEYSLAEVEQIVSKLEGGDLNLTDSLAQYELGIRRLKQCHKLLEAAEQRVSLLSGFDADGNPVRESLADHAGKTKVSRRTRDREDTPASSEAEDLDVGGGNARNPADSVDDPPGLF